MRRFPGCARAGSPRAKMNCLVAFSGACRLICVYGESCDMGRRCGASIVCGRAAGGFLCGGLRVTLNSSGCFSSTS